MLICTSAVSCVVPEGPKEVPNINTGTWLMHMDLGDAVLPFSFDLQEQGGVLSMNIRNGAETIAVSQIDRIDDSLHIQMPLFDSRFRGLVVSPTQIRGIWQDRLRGPSHKIPFMATYGPADRFAHSGRSSSRSEGKWEVQFSPGTPDAYPAVGLFHVLEGRAIGTFVTETGDYRYLEGVDTGDSLMLSCFDGAHAFLFKAALKEDEMAGRFWSGDHWQEPWTATRNNDARLRHPDSLTFLKEGYEMIDFTFEDLNGDLVSPKAPRFRDKVLLVQIMGSWCPNCVDETRLLCEAFSTYHADGLEVISLAFEKHTDPTRATEGLKRFRDQLNIPYSLALAGHSSKDSAAKALPFLDHVMSYPTCIVIDRTGKVRNIHTGFYGPGTGALYTAYRTEFLALIGRMMNETSSIASR